MRGVENKLAVQAANPALAHEGLQLTIGVSGSPNSAMMGAEAFLNQDRP